MKFGHGEVACEDCGAVLEGAVASKHVCAKTLSLPKSVECKHCGKALDSVSFKEHMTKEHPNTVVTTYKRRSKPAEKKPLICELCGKVLASSSQHMRIHREKTYHCPREGCLYVTYTKPLLALHKVHVFDETAGIPCEHCDHPPFQSRKELFQHMYLKHASKCDECGRKFRTASGLEQHKKMHRDQVVCELCGCTVTRARLKQHIKGNCKK